MPTTLLPQFETPSLQEGERLSRAEFERRYEAMPDTKAELLDGVVYIMSSPISTYHAQPQAILSTLFVTYMASTPGVSAGGEATVRLPRGSNPQPDCYLRIEEAYGGQSHVEEDRYLAGSPELLGEISYSSLERDRNIKRPIYQRDGIREMIIWRVEDSLIEWYVLQGRTYDLVKPDPDGIMRSLTFPGLWIDAEAMSQRDVSRVLRVLALGLASDEHERFVRELALKKKQA